MQNTVFAEQPGTTDLSFVGDFDAKYEAEADPWDQSGQVGERAPYYEYSRAKLVSRLAARLKPGAKGLEIGCGYGYVTALLAKNYYMTGMDVAEKAIQRAEHLNPGIEYFRYDVTEPYIIEQAGKFHFVVLGQCWWYILHELPTALRNCLNYLETHGLLVVSQAFLKEQRYGKDIADGFDGALKLLMAFSANPMSAKRSLQLVEAHYDDTGLLPYHDGLLILRKLDHG
jgi:SAM-dependent methyltransferase